MTCDKENEGAPAVLAPPPVLNLRQDDAASLFSVNLLPPECPQL